MAKHSARRILITGASRGLGRGLVDEFVTRGHTVLGCGTNRQAIEALRRDFGPPNSFEIVDVSCESQVRDWATSVNRDGPPDLLLNNAAIINRNAPLWKVPAEEFDRLIDVNIKGVANVIRHFLPAMIAAGQGIIVNFSSGWGRSVSPDVAPYCASKWAIEGLTQALAEELPRGMAAIPVNPGIINTDMLQSCFENADSYPDAQQWASRAAPFLLKLGPKDNGQSLTAP